jgi:hypothetical protein
MFIDRLATSPISRSRMIRAAANYLQTIPTVFIDGSIYTILAVLAFNQLVFTSDEAAKYIAPIALFFAKWINGCANAGFLADQDVIVLQHLLTINKQRKLSLWNSAIR